MINKFNIKIKEIIPLSNKDDIIDLNAMMDKNMTLFIEEYYLNEKCVHDRYKLNFICEYDNHSYKRNCFVIDYCTFRSKNKKIIVEAKDMIIRCELI